MPFIDLIPEGATPGRRTRLLAERMGGHITAWNNGTSNLKGGELKLYQSLSTLQCWDAAMYCAWMAKGINCASISIAHKSLLGLVDETHYSNLFGENPNVAADANQMRNMPEGCFVGFERNGVLRHTMLHLQNGMGAGNKNDCVLRAGHTIGYEVLDMTAFFGADAGFNNNGSSRVIYKAVAGQTIVSGV